MGSKQSATRGDKLVPWPCKPEMEERTGKRMWHPVVAARGIITPQLLPSTLHSMGTSGVLKTIIPAIKIHETVRDSQYFFKIFGTSLKKLLFCTSLTVAPQVMFNENIWARMETLIGIPRPPKKKKKNGIHLTFSRHDQRSPLYPNRYSRRMNEIAPDPMNTTELANQISKLCM